MLLPATRGIWIDAIAAMHEDRRSGAISGTLCQLTRVLRSGKQLMDELCEAELQPVSGQEQFESPVWEMVNESLGHLFVDDIEKVPARSDFRVEALFDLLDTIKRRQLAITVTSNLLC